MSEEADEDLMLRDDAGVNVAMRAEAAARAQAVNNWTMASSLTANGGAALALLSHGESGVVRIVALGFFMLGITAALVAGRFASNLAHETESLFLTLIFLDRAEVHRFRIARLGNQAMTAAAQESVSKLLEQVKKDRADLDKAYAPDTALGVGVILFFVGCIVSGFAVF